MTKFKVMVIKTKFIVAKYDKQPLISIPGRFFSKIVISYPGKHKKV